jgi:hypothetical protein
MKRSEYFKSNVDYFFGNSLEEHNLYAFAAKISFYRFRAIPQSLINFANHVDSIPLNYRFNFHRLKIFRALKYARISF